MKAILGGVIATAGILCACATMPPRSEPLTKIESRELPPEIVTSIVMGQIADLLLYDQPSSSRARPPSYHLDRADFFSRPRASQYPGMCMTSRLFVEFESTRLADLGADAPVRASSFETTRLFRILDSPPPEANTPTREPTEHDHAVCAELDPRTTEFFEADEEVTAHNATLLKQMLASSSNDAVFTFEIDCQVRRSEDGCRSVLSEVAAAPIEFARRCDDERAGYCYYLQAGGHALVIVASNIYRHDRPELGLHWEINRVRVSDLIVLYHSRPD
jgi:hypothetical protein